MSSIDKPSVIASGRSIGDAFRNLRRIRRISQEALADRAGVDRTCIIRIEQGHAVRFPTLQLVAMTLDMDFSRVLREAEMIERERVAQKMSHKCNIGAQGHC